MCIRARLFRGPLARPLLLRNTANMLVLMRQREVMPVYLRWISSRVGLYLPPGRNITLKRRRYSATIRVMNGTTNTLGGLSCVCPP